MHLLFVSPYYNLFSFIFASITFVGNISSIGRSANSIPGRSMDNVVGGSMLPKGTL